MNTEQLQELLKQDKEIDFNELENITFHEYLTAKLKDSPARIIEKTSIQRNYAHQIFNGTRLPGRDKLIQIALAMKLSLHDTNNLLSLSNNGSLYPKVKRDAILIYAFHNHLSVIDTNCLLADNRVDILE